MSFEYKGASNPSHLSQLTIEEQFNIKGKFNVPFGTTPVDAEAATAVFGTGANGVVTATFAVKGTIGNVGLVNISVNDDESEDLSLNISTTNQADDTLNIVLGTDSEGDPDDSKNTATLIAAAIDEIEVFSASASGNGTGVVGVATAIVGDPEEATAFLTVTSDDPIKNKDIKIIVEDGIDRDGALTIAHDDGVITITLGMTDEEIDDPAFLPDDTKNTATLIRAAIDALDGISASHDGDGSGVPDIEDGDEISFTGGLGFYDFSGGVDCTDGKEGDIIVNATSLYICVGDTATSDTGKWKKNDWASL